MLKLFAALAATLLAALTPTPAVRHAQTQAVAPLAGARLNHIAIAVRELQPALKTFADLVGVDVPATRQARLDAVGGGKVGWDVAFINTPNFFLELDQPPADGTPSPVRTFLDKYGPGIQHIGFGIDGPLAPVIEGLQQKGGIPMVNAGGRAAFLDLTSSIGMVVELVQGGNSPSQTPPPTDPHRLAANQVDHVGFVYRDARPAIASFAGLLGVAAPAPAALKSIDYLPAAHARKNAHVRGAQIAAGGVGIEVMEPVGGDSPWARHRSARGGNPPHHIAFRYSNQPAFDAAVRRLQQSGVWVSGKRGVERAQKGTNPAFEFGAFGMTIELIAPSLANN